MPAGPTAVDARRRPALRAPARHVAAPLAGRRRVIRRSRRSSCRSCARSSTRGRRPPSARPRSSNADASRDLVRNATATRYAWRWMMPTTLAHAVSFRFDQATPATELATWWSRPRRRDPAPRPGGSAEPAARLGRAGSTPSTCRSPTPPTSRPAPTPARAWPASPRRRSPSCSPPGRQRASAAAPPWGTQPAHRAGAPLARRHARRSSPAAPPASRAASSSRSASTRARRRRPRRGRCGCSRPTSAAAATRRSASAATCSTGCRPSPTARVARHRPWPARRARHGDQPARPVGDRHRLAPAAGPGRRAADARRVRLGRRTAPDGRPTPDHRFVLAPSTEQATVAAVLRDRALHDPDADAAGSMDLTSDAVRGALRLAAETREGSHPAESLGRHGRGHRQPPRRHRPAARRLPDRSRFFAGPRACSSAVCATAPPCSMPPEQRPDELSAARRARRRS